MITLSLFIFGKQHTERKVKITANDKASTKIHESNVEAIANGLKEADTLKQVLEANGISINISAATGHKNRGTRNLQPTIQRHY